MSETEQKYGGDYDRKRSAPDHDYDAKRMAYDGPRGGATGPTGGRPGDWQQPDLTLRCLVLAKDVGILIGKGGTTIKTLREENNCRINVTESVPNVNERVLSVVGRAENVGRAYGSIIRRLEESAANNITEPPSKLFVNLLVPNSQTGAIIGRSEMKVKEIESSCGITVTIASSDLPDSTERVVTLAGPGRGLARAAAMIAQILFDNPPQAPVAPFRPMPMPPSQGPPQGGPAPYDPSSAYGQPAYGGAPAPAPYGAPGAPYGAPGQYPGQYSAPPVPATAAPAPYGADPAHGAVAASATAAATPSPYYYDPATGTYQYSAAPAAAGAPAPGAAGAAAPGGAAAAAGAAGAGGQSYDYAQYLAAYYAAYQAQATASLAATVPATASTGSMPVGAALAVAGQTPGPGETVQIVNIPKDYVGAIIGKGGIKINEIRNTSGCKIKVTDPIPGALERQVILTGTVSQCEKACSMLNSKIQEELSRRGDK